MQDIIGTVVFIKTKPLPPLDEEIYDYEVDGLSNEDVELIKKIFTEDNQAKLSKSSMRYTKTVIIGVLL